MKRAMDDIKASSDDISENHQDHRRDRFPNEHPRRSTPPSRPPAPARPAWVSPSSPTRSAISPSVLPNRPAKPPKKSKLRSRRATTASPSRPGSPRTLSEIVTKAREVDTLVAEIAQASIEQSQGIGQLNTAMSQMDAVTQTNAAAAEESASSAEELNAQAAHAHRRRPRSAQSRRFVRGKDGRSASDAGTS